VYLQIEGRKHQQGEKSRRDEAADHDDCQWTLNLSSMELEYEQWKQAKRRGPSRHQLRAYSANARLSYGLREQPTL
jgi:hypothetical protein